MRLRLRCRARTAHCAGCGRSVETNSIEYVLQGITWAIVVVVVVGGLALLFSSLF
jgi:hypothetical protein